MYGEISYLKVRDDTFSQFTFNQEDNKTRKTNKKTKEKQEYN